MTDFAKNNSIFKSLEFRTNIYNVCNNLNIQVYYFKCKSMWYIQSALDVTQKLY